jgi:hypothetical protein
MSSKASLVLGTGRGRRAQAWDLVMPPLHFKVLYRTLIISQMPTVAAISYRKIEATHNITLRKALNITSVILR